MSEGVGVGADECIICMIDTLIGFSSTFENGMINASNTAGFQVRMGRLLQLFVV